MGGAETGAEGGISSYAAQVRAGSEQEVAARGESFVSASGALIENLFRIRFSAAELAGYPSAAARAAAGMCHSRPQTGARR